MPFITVPLGDDRAFSLCLCYLEWLEGGRVPTGRVDPQDNAVLNTTYDFLQAGDALSPVIGQTESDPILYRGIDVSEWNGNVDFLALRDQIDFVILRCGYGSDFPNQDDSRFARNVRACAAAGIPYGVYLYAYAQNETMARSEAAHMLRLLHGEDPDFGVWYDVEDTKLPFQSGKVAALCKVWCDAMLAAGCTCVGIYASLHNMKTYLSGSELKPYEKWVAQWKRGICDYPHPGIWQFTDCAKLGGQGPFDMNYAYRDYPELTGGAMTQQKFNEMMENYLQSVEAKASSDWAAEAWREACKRGVFDGTAPQSPLTREEAAIILKKLGLS